MLVANYGLPSRKRCDEGRENIAVSEFMLRERGTGRVSCITGQSVHNQRNEQFWRDLLSGCTALLYRFLYCLEDSDLLDHLNPLDLYCLHYIFLPRINHQLQSFHDDYSQHRLRTERNMSPLQL